jgi:hypothetical protein
VLEALSELRHRGSEILRGALPLPGQAMAPDPAGVLGELGIVRVAGGVEQRHHRGVAQPLDEVRGEHRRLAPLLDDLPRDPVKVLPRGVAHRQRVDGVLEGHCAERLQPAPDLHPEVVRLRGDLVDEQEPAAALLRGVFGRWSPPPGGRHGAAVRYS